MPNKQSTNRKTLGNNKESKRNFSILATTISIVSIVISIIGLIISGITCYTTFNKNTFDQRMQLTVNQQKDDLQTIGKTVSQTETISHKIELTEDPNKVSRNDIVDIYSMASNIQNSYYSSLNLENKYANRLNKELTAILKRTKELALNKIQQIDAVLPATGGEDPKLESLFQKYQSEEIKQIKKNKTQ